MLDRSGRADEPAPGHERVFNIPGPVLWTLAALALIHAIRALLPERWDETVLSDLAFVPGRLTYAWDPRAVIDGLVRLATGTGETLRQAQAGRFFLGDGSAQPWTVLTYAVLHAGWVHLGVNALWLLAFGAPVARRLGAWRFQLFLAATSVAGAAVHYLAHYADLQPVIGASAAVSGCMAATLRFAVEPRGAGRPSDGDTRPLVPPLLSLAGVLRDRRALAFIAVWFATNLLFGLGAVRMGGETASIAWEAHVGGFVAGLLALPAFDRRARPPSDDRGTEESETPPVGGP